MGVTADGVGIVSHVGAVLLRELADASGLTAGWTKAVIGTYHGVPTHLPGRVLVDLAVSRRSGSDTTSHGPRPSSRGRLSWWGRSQVAYGTPSRYEITLYRATITRLALAHGWTVQILCDEALGFGGLDLDSCPRADLKDPPKPFKIR